jgi:rhamnogalacturonyl hydrolase YesR
MDRGGFKYAAENFPLAGIGTIPVQVLEEGLLTIEKLNAFRDIAKSPAHLVIERRVSRSPAELAHQLALDYGHAFSTPAYVPGMGLIGRMRLGFVGQVEALLTAYLDGSGIEIDNPSLMAGQLVFAEHAELTRDPRSIALVERAAALAFDEQGNLKEVMPFHSEMSDSVFMAPPLLAKAGRLTGNVQYFDMVEKHVNYMQELLLRDDGLYSHSPLADVAWSRGNAFPALGLALVLSDLPEEHPAYKRLMDFHISHLDVLLTYQNADGLWRQVIDFPGSYSELSSTAMIGIAIKRGLDRGWLAAEKYQPVVDSIWAAVLERTSVDNEFIDVCISTGKLSSLDAYLDRSAILGRDDRAGGMIMNLAIELAGSFNARQ